MENLILLLILGGILGGTITFFVNYLELPVLKSLLFDDPWPKPKHLILAIVGYIVIGMCGGLLTPLVNEIVGLKGYGKDKLVILGYAIVFGYSTSKILLSLFDSIIKKSIAKELQMRQSK